MHEYWHAILIWCEFEFALVTVLLLLNRWFSGYSFLVFVEANIILAFEIDEKSRYATIENM